MKLTAFFLMIAFCHVSAKGVAQHITLSARDETLATVLQEIRKQAGYVAFYDDSLLRKSYPVTLDVYEQPVLKVLDMIFREQPLTYEIVSGNIITVKGKKNIDRPQVLTEIQKTFVNIRGRVMNEQGEIIPGVTVIARLKDTTFSTVTDNDGMFHFDIPSATGTLTFRHIGHEEYHVPVSSVASFAGLFTVRLKVQTRALNDVVVIGYGQVNRQDITGAVSSVDVKALSKAPVKSYDEALAGRIAGVMVSSADGQPGSMPNITIRGNSSITQDNSPLYVVDGFPLEENNSNSINMAEIESIEVLKDASATAIYGARAANGVILITTKKGKGKTAVTYDAYVGVNNAIKTQELLSPYEFIRYQSELNPANTAAIYFQDGKTLESYKDKKAIDWQDEILRPALFQNHSIAVRGGEGKTSFSVSGSVMLQDGIILNSGFNRYQGRVVLDHKVSERFRTGVNINYASMKSYGTKIANYGGSNNKLSLLASAWGYRPTTQGADDQLVDMNLDPDIDPLEDYRYNPVKTASNELHEDKEEVLSLNLYGSYNLSPNLVLRISGGLNSSAMETVNFYSSNTRNGDIRTPQGMNGPNGRVMNTKIVNMLNENTLTYKKRFKSKHNVEAVVGFTNQRRDYLRTGFGATNLPNETLGVHGLQEGTMNQLTTIKTYNTLASFLGRANYSYKGKYYFTTSLRADGSSKFSPDNKWSYFPTVAGAYRFTAEPFMKNQRALSNGKLRVSYGVAGNNRVSDFPYLSTLVIDRGAAYSFNGTFYSGADLEALGNHNLKWENTATFNAGMDLEFFRSRVNFTFDYYYKNTYDLLLNAQMAGSTGYTSAFQNIGKVSNRGVEFDLQLVNIEKKDFSWKTSFNISFNRNRVEALQSGEQSLLSPVRWDASAYRTAPVYVARVGEPIAMLYGYVFDGLYQESDFNRTANGGYILKSHIPNNQSSRTAIRPGYVKYRDLNGDIAVDAKDQTIIGNPNPLHFGGFGNDFQYKNFDLNIFFQWSYGNDIFNANRLAFEGTTSYNLNQFASVANRWTPENTNTLIPVVQGQGQAMYSSRVVEDGSYLRLKTVQLGYNLPAARLQRAKIQSIRLYAAAQNLMTWTNYSGLDPEVSTYNSGLTPGFDYSPYPRARTITFGLNLVL